MNRRPDPDIARTYADWCDVYLSFGSPVRVGLAPKSLRLFRVDAPIRKHSSKVFLDAEGRKCQVEILGEGEQFVAYAIHPDTQKPYTWPDGDLVDTKYDDLPLITLTDVRSADLPP